jgi:Na+-driven multidrug efflux pump
VLTGGISFATIFYLGQKKYSVKTSISGNLFFTLLFSFFSFILSFLIIFLGGKKLFPDVSPTYLYLSLLIIPPSCFLDYFSGILLGIKKIRQYTFLSFFVDFFQFIFVFVLLYVFSLGIKGAIVSQIISLILSCLFLISEEE